MVKEALIRAIEMVVPCRDASGRRLFGGHSCGVAGRRFWVARGLEILRLQVLASWESRANLRYIADAPLEPAIWFNGRHPASSSAVFELNYQGEDEDVLARKLRQFMSEAVAKFQRLVEHVPVPQI